MSEYVAYLLKNIDKNGEISYDFNYHDRCYITTIIIRKKYINNMQSSLKKQWLISEKNYNIVKTDVNNQLLIINDANKLIEIITNIIEKYSKNEPQLVSKYNIQLM